jgi:hypothetical protein
MISSSSACRLASGGSRFLETLFTLPLFEMITNTSNLNIHGEDCDRWLVLYLARVRFKLCDYPIYYDNRRIWVISGLCVSRIEHARFLPRRGT